MKRQRKIFALLAAILMMASLLSIGVGAEGTAEREENLRNITYVAAASTYIYSNQGGTGTTTSVSKRARVSSSRSMTSWQNIVTGSGDHWPDASRGGVSGYMWDRKICPKSTCYKTTQSAYLYTADDGLIQSCSINFPSGTIMHQKKINNAQTYRSVIMLYNGNYYTGWIKIGYTAKEDGTA